MPLQRELYPPDWEAISDRIRFARAGGRCEQCGAVHGSFVGRGPDQKSLNPATRIILVVLTTAHLDRDPSNNQETNLRALCQRCHLNYDRGDNQQKSRFGKNFKRDQIPIEVGPNENSPPSADRGL